MAFFGDALRDEPTHVQIGGPLLVAWSGLWLLVRHPSRGFTRPDSAEARAIERIESGASVEDTLRDLLRERRKITAIKVYRRVKGGGLAEAKDSVESLARAEKA